MDNSLARARGDTGYFPLNFYVDFLNILNQNRKWIEIITYKDLCWADDYDYLKSYPRERDNWQKRIRDGALDPKKIYVVIQHDVDSYPECTIDILRHEERLGIRSNVMIFNRRINRRHLAATGELQYTAYPLDYSYLCYLQDSRGFVIGYHSNAVEQALHDLEKAEEIFESDIAELRKHFKIDFFSPHGGVFGPKGLNNHHLSMPASLEGSLRWVHNRYTPWFSANYSDGGINLANRDPGSRDLREYVKSWKVGGRYRVLTHPQYYIRSFRRSPRLSGTPWYEEVMEMYASPKRNWAWNEVSRVLKERGSSSSIVYFESAKWFLKSRMSKLCKRIFGV